MKTDEPPGTREETIGSFDSLSFPELFHGLSDAARLDLEAAFERVHLTGGETLLRQGDAGDCMYVLLTGRLRAYVRRPEGNEAVVGEVGRGEVVGEMALLLDEPRSATVRAIRDSDLLRLPKEVFDRFIEKYPLALKQISRVNLRRLRRSILFPRVESSVATIAVVPAGRESPLSTFAESLAAALAAIGPTLHLSRDRLPRQFGESRPQAARALADESRIGAWLSEQETKYRYVIYESDKAQSPWTRRCLRQADHVLAVGVGRSDPALGEAEAEIQPFDWRGLAGRRDLVLLQSDDLDRPTGTQAWLAGRHVDGHHHLRTRSKADYERLARFLTGGAVGLVLGAGGARGMAHIGAIRAIRELGIPIDLVGGTSIGALVAGALATGMEYESLVATALERLVAVGSLLDLTLPLVSLISGRKMSRGLERTFGDLMIEDLWLNYFCVSSNLSRARMVVHQRGLVRKGIRASISLPGILPPVIQDRDLLVDGGLMNKLPVDVMRGRCNGGKVLAINVDAEGGLEVGDAYGDHVSGWRLLGKRLNPFRSGNPGPNIASILLCSTLVNSDQAQLALEREADVCVQVSPAPIGLFDFKSLHAMIDAGYEATLKQLDGWWALNSGPAARTSSAVQPFGPTTLSEALHPSA